MRSTTVGTGAAVNMLPNLCGRPTDDRIETAIREFELQFDKRLKGTILVFLGDCGALNLCQVSNHRSGHGASSCMQAPSCSTLPLGGETASLALQNIGAMCYRTTGRSLPLLHLYGSATYALVTGRAIVSHLHRVPTVGMDQCRLAMHVA